MEVLLPAQLLGVDSCILSTNGLRVDVLGPGYNLAMAVDPLLRPAIRAAIRRVPRGKVATYGQVAAAAGYPGYARQVAQVLRGDPSLPWQRIIGNDGELRLRGESGYEQRMRLEAEGVTFRGRRVDLDRHQYRFRILQR